jgi:hypothetical protein
VRQKARKSINLLKWPEEFQPKEAHIAHNVLAEYFRRNGRGFIGHQAGGSRGGSGNGQVDKLVRPEDVGGGDTGTVGANIERLGQLNEFGPRSVRTPQEDRYLESDPGRPTRLLVIQVLAFLHNFAFHAVAP